jgi:hypothetical protein
MPPQLATLVCTFLAPAAAAAAAGYTNYLSAFSPRFGSYPQCLNRVHVFEKTLPGLGGRSVVDGGLSDSGAVLAHEVGHQLVRKLLLLLLLL